MRKYIMLSLVILALMPFLVSAAEECTASCSSLGYDCGIWTICGEDINCGSCHSDESCHGGICLDDCDSHDERRCYKGDVYWYDSCGHREGKYESCDDYCSDGRCREDDDYDSGYWHDGHYYSYTHDTYYMCDHFCNYRSICAETGYDGCGLACNRITDGLGCGTEGVCSGGACVTKQKAETAPQVVVQGLMPYPYVPYSPPKQRAEHLDGADLLTIMALTAGCVLFLLLIGLLIGRFIRR